LSSHTHGNLIIGQSGGATAVINASLVGAIEAALQEGQIDNMYGMLHGIEGFLHSFIITRTILLNRYSFQLRKPQTPTAHQQMNQ